MTGVTLTFVLLEPKKEVTKLSTRPQDAESTQGKIGHHNCDQKLNQEVTKTVPSARLCTKI